MTRIIAGVARGRRLAVPAAGTRPTGDRVREAMFSAIQSHVAAADGGSMVGLTGMVVLDLFAGSGALGLEAASRGADRVTLVEQDRAAAAVCRANADVVTRGGDTGPVEVVIADVVAFVGGNRPLTTPAAGLVLADPPYAWPTGDLTALLHQLGRGGWLAADALVVVERATSSGPVLWPGGIRPWRWKRYGATCLWYGRADGASP